MKIIKKTDTAAWSYKHTCDKCDTEMEIEMGDLLHQHHSGYGRETDYDEYYTHCPVCNQKISLVTSKVPGAVQVLVKQKSSYSGIGDVAGAPWDR